VEDPPITCIEPCERMLLQMSMEQMIFVNASQVSIPTIECDGATPTKFICRKYTHHITVEYIKQWNMLECRKRQSTCFTVFIFWYWMRRLVIYPAKICRFGRQVPCLHRYMELFHVLRSCNFANEIFGPSHSQIIFFCYWSKPWYLVNPKIAGKWMFIPLKMYL
jgi:hypothetical protein